MHISVAGGLALLSLAASGVVARADPAPQVTGWNDWYAGANFGYGWGRSDTSASFFDNFNNVTPGPVLLTSHGTVDMDGVIGGLQIGRNWQNGNWIWGIETDIQASGQKGNKAFTCPAANCASAGVNTDLTAATANQNQKLDWFGTLRARLGAPTGPATMSYVTGGLAYGRVKTSDLLVNTGTAGLLVSTCPGPTCPNPPTAGNGTKTGWTIGTGAEQRLFGNWSGKIEYLFVNLGRTHSSGIFPTGQVTSNSVPIQVNLSSKITGHILRLGLNYQY